MSEPGAIAEAAFTYASHGLHVIALHGVTDDGRCTCPNAECASPGKHPRRANWQREATANAEFVRGMWKWADDEANVGIVAGPSGLVIVDIDGERGMQSFKRLTSGDTAGAYMVRTGRGWHLYLADDVGHRPFVGSGDLAGVDLRAGLSYVVAPPSRHANGGAYEWA